MPYVDNVSYVNFIINGFITTIYASIIVITINFIFYGDRFKGIYQIIKRLLKKTQKTN